MSKRAEFSITKKDFDVSWYSGTGAGGQHRNRHMNSCRLRHRETGVTKTGQNNRDRASNQRDAMRAMAEDPRILAFCEMRLREIERGETLEEVVDRMMAPENLKIEFGEK